MKRPFSDFTKNLIKVPIFLWYFFKCLFLFKKPAKFIYHYLTLAPLKDSLITLRSGLKIYLSSHPDDIKTIFVIFVRKDYGVLPKEGVVVDIGANIGVFSLYAAHLGKACKVLAYEPNQEAFDTLVKNIKINNLTSIITPNRLAVTKDGLGKVKFPKKSSAHNRIIYQDAVDDFDEVETISLSKILYNIEKVDLLKLDCEGAEYEILLNSNLSILCKIDNIKMEYHCGSEDDLIKTLSDSGFSNTLYEKHTKKCGNLWFSRSIVI